MHALLARQVADARHDDGTVDLDRLLSVIADVYAECFCDRDVVDSPEGLRRLVRERTLELKTVEATLHAALENVEQGILMVDSEGFVPVCNRRAAELLDLPADLVARKPSFADILEFQWTRGEFTGSGEEFRRWVRSGGVKNSPPLYVRTFKSGRSIEVRTMLLPDGGAVRTYTDVTERLASQAALEAAEAEYRSLFQNAVVGIYRTTIDGKQLRANPALVRMNGYRTEEDMLAAVSSVEREFYVDPNRRAAFISEIMAHGRVTDFVSEVYRHNTRERIWVSETAWIVNGPDGKPAYFEGTVMEATDRKRAEERIAYVAHHDTLTDLPNRALFMQRMREIMAQPGARFALHCVDLDGFKDVNDTLGHAAGDALLQAVAQRLRRMLRENDVVARLGGDEFAIIQPDVNEIGDVHALANRVVRALGRTFVIGGQRVSVGGSVGVAIAPDHARSPEEMMQHADIALYEVKRGGRRAHRIFEPRMTAAIVAKRAIESDLRGAIARNEFVLHYQPIVDVKTRNPTAFEALLRWRHPERGLVTPIDFIPVAEETGLMRSIGAWVITEACAQAAKVSPLACIAVNLSPVQFQADDIVETVATAVETYAMNPAQLVLEITETVLLADNEATLTALDRLRAMGVRIALDDFGTGYSSLAYLRSFTFDKVKIDRSFTERIETEPAAAAIVRAVIALARDLDVDVVAEGVETEAQLDFLREQGCGEAQGFLFGAPATAETIFPGYDGSSALLRAVHRRLSRPKNTTLRRVRRADG